MVNFDFFLTFCSQISFCCCSTLFHNDELFYRPSPIIDLELKPWGPGYSDQIEQNKTPFNRGLHYIQLIQLIWFFFLYLIRRFCRKFEHQQNDSCSVGLAGPIHELDLNSVFHVTINRYAKPTFYIKFRLFFVCCIWWT